MTTTRFITDEDIEKAFSGNGVVQGPLPEELEEYGDLVLALPAPVLVQAAGTFAGFMRGGFVLPFNATGLWVPGGRFDLAAIHDLPGLVQPHPAYKFPGPDDLVVAGEDVIARAKEAYGEDWDALMRGNAVYDRTLDGRGGRGIRPVAAAAFEAERRRIERWLSGYLNELACPTPTGIGLDRWKRDGNDELKITCVVFAATGGAVGSALAIPFIALLRLAARRYGILLDPYLVLLGPRVFGYGTLDVVTPNIGPNTEAMLTELYVAMTQGVVSIGRDTVNLEEPLVPLGNVVLFDEDLTDPQTGLVSDEARAAYAGEAGLITGVAVSSGALQRAAEGEANDNNGAGALGIMRRISVAGHGIDRAGLASALAGITASRMRQGLLASLRGEDVI